MTQIANLSYSFLHGGICLRYLMLHISPTYTNYHVSRYEKVLQAKVLHILPLYQNGVYKS